MEEALLPEYKRGQVIPCPNWAERLLVRGDGRVEALCKHGCGHPVGFLRLGLTRVQPWMVVHGCCGCCSKESSDEAR